MKPSLNPIIVILLTIALLLCSLRIAQGDEGTTDEDFDYEPPEHGGVFSQIAIFFKSAFRSQGHPTSYSTAKKLMYRYLEDTQTLYCGCVPDLEERTFDASACGYEPKIDNDRAHRLEAEHVLPAFWIAGFHDGDTCWESNESCGSARECCLKNDERFKRAHNDLVNLFPTIGELNGQRSNLIYAIIDEEKREFGACDFEVDQVSDTAEPSQDIRGDIARIYFYMGETYNLTYPTNLQTMLEEWNLEDEISNDELKRNDLIQETQGSSNHFVSTP